MEDPIIKIILLIIINRSHIFIWLSINKHDIYEKLSNQVQIGFLFHSTLKNLGRVRCHLNFTVSVGYKNFFEGEFYFSLLSVFHLGMACI